MPQKVCLWLRLTGRLLERRVDGPAEVAELEHPEAIEYVFGFDVAVHNGVAVHALEGSDDLSEVVGCLIFSKAVLSLAMSYFRFELSEEAAAAGQFKQ